MPDHLRHLLSGFIITLCVATVALSLFGATDADAAGRLLQAEPTPDPCAPATLTPAGNIVNVRAGPDSESQLLDQLSADDVRPVLGRHWQLRWWQIELSDGSEGWVWDGAAVVRGNVAAVPLVALASEDGQPAEAAWEPTVEAVCVATPVMNADRAPTTPTPPASAVAEGINANQNDWSAPINLSRSGLATEPQMVVDSDGNAHVLWKEQGVDGFVYTRQLDGTWIQPFVVELPFGTRRAFPDLREDSPIPLFTPILVAGSEGAIHAFWTDDEGILRTSRVPASDFTTFEAWSQPLVIDESAVGAVTTAGEDNVLHLSYIRTEAGDDGPAGVYYRQSTDAGATWSESVLLYESRYLRAVTDQNARVQIAAAGMHVYVAWDNPILEKVFLTSSTDGGQTWAPATVVDERQADDLGDAIGPSKITLAARADEVLLLWQAAHSSVACEQHYRHSDDGGANWGANGVILDEFNTCPTDTRVVVLDSGVTLLLITVEDRSYLLAWDGAEWSEPQSQPELSSLLDPQTNRELQFIWREAVSSEGDQLAALGVARGVLGSEQSEALWTDIWFMQRSLGSTADWFPPPPPWSSPAIVADRPFQARDLVVLADSSESIIHGFLSQPEEGDPAGTAVYYTRWEGDVWTRPVPVLRSPDGPAQRLAVAAIADRLLVVWGAEAGSIYFSQADRGRAQIAAQWAEPLRLPIPHEAARNPKIATDHAGHIYIVYSVPLNEDRGIWILDSADEGKTWSAPRVIFDGAAAKVPMVDDPQLTIADNGDLHLLWKEYSLPPASVPQALNYSYSRDEGESWTSPSIVTEMPGSWSAIVALGQREAHRLWKQGTADISLGHDVSLDGGMNWSDPDQIQFSGGEQGVVTFAVDSASRVHLVQYDERGLQHRWWQDDRWLRGEDQQFDGEIPEQYILADAAITRDGYLAVLYDSRLATGDVEEESYQLLAIGRSIDLPAEQPAPTSTLAATPSPSPTRTPATTGTATPTPTRAFSGAETVPSGPAQSVSSNIPALGAPWGGAVVGIVAAALVAFVAVTVGILVLRASHRWGRD